LFDELHVGNMGLGGNLFFGFVEKRFYEIAERAKDA
jgi:hypothetical protein